MRTTSDILAIAVQHHRAGQLDIAEQLYRQILNGQPDHVDALHLLGVVALQSNAFQLAIECIQRAVAIAPFEAKFLSNLGRAFEQNGQLEQARAAYLQALQLDPNLPELYCNFGVTLLKLGRFDEALAAYQQALALRPDYAEAHNNLGVARQELGQLESARLAIERAIALQPHRPDFHLNLGNTRLRQGHLEAAIESYVQSLKLNPNSAGVYKQLGNAYELGGNRQAAIDAYRCALIHAPESAEISALLVHQLQHICEWEELEALTTRTIQLVDEAYARPDRDFAPPFILLTLSKPTTAVTQLAAAQHWGRRNCLRHERCPASRAPNRKHGDQKKVTLGYLSADFHGHATGWLIVEMIEKHCRDRFSVLGYSYGPDQVSPTRRRIVRAFDRFTDVREADFETTASMIREDEVDILIDLKGYTWQSRPEILTRRPAPIQVNYLGYPGTMGADFIDYILVDEYIVPTAQQPWYTERLVHLPGCYQANDSQSSIASSAPSRRQSGLPEQGFVFCSFNSSYKLTPTLFALWMRLLQAVPGSVLWLLESNSLVADNLQRQAERHGVPASRLVFAPKLALPEHLARHRLADLFLDSFPVNAHTTASDALRMGVPIVTLSGDTFVSRVAGSLLTALGLPELITHSFQSYEALALRLALDQNELSRFRSQLAASLRCNALYDGRACARKVEAAFEVMWKRYRNGDSPKPIAMSEIMEFTSSLGDTSI